MEYSGFWCMYEQKGYTVKAWVLKVYREIALGSEEFLRVFSWQKQSNLVQLKTKKLFKSLKVVIKLLGMRLNCSMSFMNYYL